MEGIGVRLWDIRSSRNPVIELFGQFGYRWETWGFSTKPMFLITLKSEDNVDVSLGAQVIGHYFWNSNSMDNFFIGFGYTYSFNVNQEYTENYAHDFTMSVGYAIFWGSSGG